MNLNNHNLKAKITITKNGKEQTYNAGAKIAHDLELVIRNAEGKIVKIHKQEMKSFLDNFIRAMYTRTINSGSPGFVMRNGNIANGTSINTTRISAPTNNSNYGIILGTGNTAVAFDDFDLDTPIAAGTGAGQLIHDAVVFEDIAVEDSLTYRFTAKRVFTNNSGGTITIQEVGVAANGAGTAYVLMSRDILDKNEASISVALENMFSVEVKFNMYFPITDYMTLQFAQLMSVCFYNFTFSNVNNVAGSTYNQISVDQILLSIPGNADYGIVVGSGVNGVDKDDYALQTRIASGTGAGQLTHNNGFILTAPTFGTDESYFELARSFVNNSAGTITINEVGLYSDGDGGATNFACILRKNVTAITLDPTESAQVKIKYYIGVDEES